MSNFRHSTLDDVPGQTGLRLRKTVAMVGMMGAGKTAVGRALAERLGVAFLDSDAEIERAANLTVPEIFTRDGDTARAAHDGSGDGRRGHDAVRVRVREVEAQRRARDGSRQDAARYGVRREGFCGVRLHRRDQPERSESTREHAYAHSQRDRDAAYVWWRAA